MTVLKDKVAFEVIKNKINNYTERNEETGCLHWVRAKNGKGFGTLTYNKKSYMVNRIWYMLYHNIELAKNEVVKQTCGNRDCCEISHLYHELANSEKKGIKLVTHCSVEGCSNIYEAKGYCKKHYQKFIKYGDPLGGTERDIREPNLSLREIINLYSEKDEETGCHNWTRNIQSSGYGMVFWEGRNHLVHRLWYQHEYRVELGPEWVVRHKCHNTKCCNIAHLVHGTIEDNNRDMFEAGRTARGSKNTNSILKEEDIPIIWDMINKGFTNIEIGKKFGVTDKAISDIRIGKNWNWKIKEIMEKLD